MPNVAKVLKEEMSRIGRKEARAAVAPVRKSAVHSKRSVASLKSSVARLEKQVRQLEALALKMQGQQPAAPEEAARVRVTAKGMRSLRRKLRLSQAEFARLLQVTDQSVYNWEKKDGAIRVRETTRAALLPLRAMGAREARRQLEAMLKTPKTKKSSPKRRRKNR